MFTTCEYALLNCLINSRMSRSRLAIMFTLISLNISFCSFEPLFKIPSGSTDCTLPITWATENDKAVDMFIILTNNPLWTFTSSPVESLKKHRQVHYIMLVDKSHSFLKSHVFFFFFFYTNTGFNLFLLHNGRKLAK